MAERVLVAYATRTGTTQSVGEAIAEAFRAEGAQVDVLPVRHVRSVEPYGAVVIGTPIYANRTHGQAFSFLKRHRDALAEMPVAYFAVCLTMKEDTPENRARAQAFLAPWRERVPQVAPVAVGLFGGALKETDRGGLWVRLMSRAMAKEYGGDFCDWEAIRAWAREALPALLGTRG